MSTRNRRERPLAAALCVLALSCAVPAHAQSSADDLARTHFESGASYLEQAAYESALREFQAAYDLSKRPEILINMATVHERLGHLDGAVGALDQYLKEAPTGAHAETVRIRADNLRKRLAEKPAEPVASPAPAPALAAPPPPPLTPARTEPHEAAPPSKLPAYLLFGAAGVMAAGSLVTGLLASHEHSQAQSGCGPRCTDDDLATGRALAVTSTVLTGTAVVTAAVGAYLYFGADGSASAKGPKVGFGVGPGGVAATTRWSF